MSGGDSLKTWRAENGWTQHALAAALGVSQSNISHIELGGSRPRLDLALKIAELTGGAVGVTAWSRVPLEAQKSGSVARPRKDKAVAQDQERPIS